MQQFIHSSWLASSIFHFHPLQGQQEVSFTHCLRTYKEISDWIAFIDVDEFLLLKNHLKVESFIESFDNRPDAIHFNTLNAGHNGHIDRPKGSVIENFPLRKAEVEAFTKCIVNTDSIDLGKLDNGWGNAWWHNISAITFENSNVINVLGLDMNNYYTGGIHDNWVRMSNPSFHEQVIETASLYHCGMKSENDMLRRYKRGLAGVYSGQLAWKELHEQGRDAVLAFLNQYNQVYESRLLQIRRLMLSGASRMQLAPARPGINIAPRGYASQSSVSGASRSQTPSEDAANVVDDKPSGFHHHCTDIEDKPWWQLEFAECQHVGEIWIYNRLDNARDRFRNFRLLIKRGNLWSLLIEKLDNEPFGGVDGRMFRLAINAWIEGVKIEGIGTCLLDLDQVEIFALPISENKS